MGKGVTSKSSQKSAKSSKSSKSTKTPTKTKTIAKGTKFTKTIECYRTAAEYFRDDDKYAKCGFSTKAIHAGNQPDPLHGGVAPSIDLSATYAQPQPGEMSTCFDYLRCGNNTVLSLQRNLASMEGSKYALCFNTGMGAIVTMMSVLQPKDHLLIIDDVYAGCQRYLRKIFIPQTGIAWDMIDFTNLAFVKKAFKKNTKICWIESPTNPTLKCVDIAAIAKMCKERGVLLVIDNTFMSPALQNPIKLGADVVLHSITKYIGGHSDVTGGALCMNCPKLYEQLFFNMKCFGNIISPFSAYLALRGSKTLQVRAEKASENALAVAKHLQKHPKIEKVVHPGLKSHPHYALAQKNKLAPHLNGGSGMMGIYIKGDIKKTNKFLSSLKLFVLAESLGGVECLIESPALMTHGSVPPEHRKMLGIDDNYCRVSIGIESVADIIADLDQALAKI